jgi:hypothetical protein
VQLRDCEPLSPHVPEKLPHPPHAPHVVVPQLVPSVVRVHVCVSVIAGASTHVPPTHT